VFNTYHERNAATTGWLESMSLKQAVSPKIVLNTFNKKEHNKWLIAAGGPEYLSEIA